MARPLQPADDVVDGVADRLQVLEVLVVDAEPDGALAELLLERFDELDQREGVGIEVVGEALALGMVDGSISRMSARRSRMSSNTCWRSMGPRSTWVSAGTATPARGGYWRREHTHERTLCACERSWAVSRRRRRPAAARRCSASSSSLATRTAFTIGRGRGRAVGDQADPLEPEEHGPTGVVGVERTRRAA